MSVLEHIMFMLLKRKKKSVLYFQRQFSFLCLAPQLLWLYLPGELGLHWIFFCHQWLTMQSPATLLSGFLIPSESSCKASFSPLHTALLVVCVISHAKPTTHRLISIEGNLTAVRLLQTYQGCSTPLLSILQLSEVQNRVADYKVRNELF